MADRGRGGRGQNLPFHPRGGGRGDRGGFRGDRGGGGFRGDRGGGRGDRGGRGGGGRGRGGGGPVEVEVFRPDNPVVDAAITKIENETVAQAKQDLVKNAKSISPVHPPRPGYGTKGKEVVLWANYFKMVSTPDLVLERYQLDIKPGENARAPSVKMIRRIVQLLIEDQFRPNDIDVATDFRSNLISKQKLELESEYVVAFRSEGEDAPPENAKQYKVTLQHTGTLTVSQLLDYVTSTRASEMFGSKDEIIQALNIVVGHHPKAASTIANVGANRHYPKNPNSADTFDLGAGLTAIRGFFVSVRAATARVLVNVQVKNMAFFNSGPLVGLIYSYSQVEGKNLAKLQKFLKKLTVDVTHIERKNKAGRRIARIKTIWGLASKDDGRRSDHPPRVTAFGAGAKNVEFYLDGGEGKAESSKGKAAAGPSSGKKGKKAAKAGPEPPSQGGRYISVFDFFKQEYNITIQQPEIPVVNVGSRDKPTYLPAQVCTVLEGQPANAKLSSAQTQSMIKFAVRKPHLNAQSVVSSGGLLGFDPQNPTLSAFGTSITPKMIAVPGRVLDGPEIKYFQNGSARPRFGTWNLQDVKFSAKTALPKWTCLRIMWKGTPGHSMQWRSPAEMKASIDSFTDALRKVGVNAGPCQAPLSGPVLMLETRDFELQIDDAMRQIAASPNRPRLVFVILPERDNTAIYNRVKYACDVKEGLLNVCVIDKKFAVAKEQYYANVGLKFNMKLGGRNHSLEPSKMGIIKDKKTMVVGIDVTHPSPGSSSSAPSVAGIVASIDEFLGQWPADIRIQEPGKEMVSELDDMFESRLRLWQKHNKTLPENVLIYRDGVSEGQYDQVLDKELPAIREACKRVYPAADTKANKPKLSIFIVGKRHHTRFYATSKDSADRSGNPANGTVVERGVTEARNWDFFVQAHAAIQGTARPAHYYVVYDQVFRDRQAQNPSGPSATDALLDLTHNMCYLFGRATKAVSICPPAYYADLVCERARCYLAGLFEPSPLTSPEASGAGSSAVGPGAVPEAGAVRIHEAVRDSMFYV